jgi:hypothetical protein
MQRRLQFLRFESFDVGSEPQEFCAGVEDGFDGDVDVVPARPAGGVADDLQALPGRRRR